MPRPDWSALWRAAEAVHAVVYFSPHASAVYRGIGLAGFWMGYFAGRAAALGTPPAPVVVAAFHGFAPRMVGRAIPAAWTASTWERIVAARQEIAAERLQGLALDAVATDAIDAVLDALPRADVAGRVLGAANLAMPVPADPRLRLWQIVTILREYRGDTHVAGLVTAGLDGVQANVLWQARGLVPAHQQQARGWTDAEWATATDSLEDRGWIASGSVTPAGEAAAAAIDTATDLAVCAGLAPVAPTLARLLPVLATAAADARVRETIPYPNPTGVRRA